MNPRYLFRKLISTWQLACFRGETIVTCYFRQLKDIFTKAGIEVTKENKKEIDKIIQHIVGLENKHCPEVWREVKKKISEDEQGFVAELKNAWTKHR